MRAEKIQKRGCGFLLALLLCLLALAGAGCRKRTVQAAPPVVVSQPAPSAESAPAKPAPETKTEPVPVNPAPAPVMPTSKPPSPRPVNNGSKPPTPAPASAETASPKPVAPQISPRLTSAEQAEYQHKTQEAIGAAERNLQQAYGRKLNAAQLDMMEKIRGFLAQSREAGRGADWVRALTLAQKALVLSNELAGTL